MANIFSMIGYAWRYAQSRAFFRNGLRGGGCNLPRADGSFWAHPRRMEDVLSWMPFMKLLPQGLVNTFAYNSPPFLVAPFTGIVRPDGTSVGFYFGATLLFPRQMLHDGVTVERMKQMLDLARACGNEVAAFGAWLPAMSDNGQAVVGYNGVAVTTGHSLTTGHLIEILKAGLAEGGIDPQGVTTALVGLGNIGTAVYKQLLYEERQGRIRLGRILLVELPGKSYHIAELARIRGNVEMATDLSALRQASVIIVTSGAEEIIIHPEHIGQSVVLIVQDSEPWNIGPRTVRALREQGKRVLLLDVLTRMPSGVGIDFYFGGEIGRRGGPMYACACEGMVRACLRISEDAVGLPSPDDVDRIVGQAAETDFVPAAAPFYQFGRPVTEAEWTYFGGGLASPREVAKFLPRRVVPQKLAA